MNTVHEFEIGPTTRMECKVCWYVYDPVAGDEEWQVPPGVPFNELPEHWTCPLCGASKDQFLIIQE